MIKNWNTRQFRNELLNLLEKRGEMVGVLVRQDARRRLSTIQDPIWGTKYRKGALVPLIDFVVERKMDEVIVTVGMGTSSSASYLKQSVSTHFGFYIEMGSRRFPPHPYLRPAVFENGGAIVRIFEG